MPKTAVEETVCDICGVEVRDESLFCYNCGGSVSILESIAPDPIPVPSEPIVARDKKPTNGSTFDPAKRLADRIESRKVRASNRQPVEVVWEPRTGFSLPFVITSLVFVLITIVVILAAFYLR